MTRAHFAFLLVAFSINACCIGEGGEIASGTYHVAEIFYNQDPPDNNFFAVADTDSVVMNVDSESDKVTFTYSVSGETFSETWIYQVP